MTVHHILGVAAVLFSAQLPADCSHEKNKPHLQALEAVMQPFSGGAAGNAPGIQYTVTCRASATGSLTQVTAFIDREELPVTIVYKNAEYAQLPLRKGDSILLRIVKYYPAEKDRANTSLLPSSNTPHTAVKAAAQIQYLFNGLPEKISIKTFTDAPPRSLGQALPRKGS